VTIHYHGTPITPNEVLYQLAGRHFCVSFIRPDQVRIAHQIGQSVMLDNGAFSAWKRKAPTNWPGFYAWCDEWLDHPNTWAIIPDVIMGDEMAQDALVVEWPHGQRGAPVWHMHEDLERLRRLTDEWSRVCIGSSAQFRVLLTPQWCRRMDAAWNIIMRGRRRVPWVHMLRGMQLVGMRWPFASVDSTDIARNHPRPQNAARAMADRWDARQCPARWEMQMEQAELFAVTS
jgi:hypothetical protein